MRPIIPPAVWEQWLADAQQYGFGTYRFGSSWAGGDRPGCLTLHFNTLVPASLYVSAEKQKAPPILFNRTPTGEIILPGRWIQEYIAAASWVEDNSPEELRLLAQEFSNPGTVDALVPAGPEQLKATSADTLLISLPDLEGRAVSQEVLLPRTEAFVFVSPPRLQTP